MNKYQMALGLFIDFYDPREWASSPHEQGDYVYASEGHIAIQIKKELVGAEYMPVEKPNFLNVFNKDRNRDETLTLAAMEKTYESIPMVDEERCRACDGCGKVEFEFEWEEETYTETRTCPVCGGTGYVESSEFRKDDRYMVKISKDCTHVKQEYFGIIVGAMRTLGLDSIRLVTFDSYAYIFETGEGVKFAVGSYVPGDNNIVIEHKEDSR